MLSYLSIYGIGLHRQSEVADEVAEIFSQSDLLSPLGRSLGRQPTHAPFRLVIFIH